MTGRLTGLTVRPQIPFGCSPVLLLVPHPHGWPVGEIFMVAPSLINYKFTA